MKIEYKSDFKKLIRIRDSQIKWLKDNKPDGVRTIAGFLDIIINNHKKKCLNYSKEKKKTS